MPRLVALAALPLVALVLAACSPGGRSGVPVQPPPVHPTAEGSPVVAPTDEETTLEPWIAIRAERPRALLDAMDGALARDLLGAPPGPAADEPLRAWIGGGPKAPSLWLAWSAAPGSGLLAGWVACDPAAHVCARRVDDLPHAVAFARARAAKDRAPGAAKQGPALTAALTLAALEPPLLPVTTGVGNALANVLDAGGHKRGSSRGEVRYSYFFRNWAWQARAADALEGISSVGLRWAPDPGGFLLDVDVAFAPGGKSALAQRLGAMPPDDGVPLATLARRCPPGTSHVIGARTSYGGGFGDELDASGLVELAGNVPLFQDTAALERSLREIWDKTSASHVACGAWTGSDITIHEIVALRDPAAVRRALSAMVPHRSEFAGRLLQISRIGAGVAFATSGMGMASLDTGLAVVDDALVIVLARPVHKRLAALLASKPLPEAPFIGDLDPAPVMFAVDMAKDLSLAGEAVLRGRVEMSGSDHAHVTIHASPGLVGLALEGVRALDGKQQ